MLTFGVLDDTERNGLEAESLTAYDGMRRRSSVTRNPEPPRVPAAVPIVSVDDHVVESPDMFVKRVPSKFGDAIPRVVENESGAQFWKFEDQLALIRGAEAVVGRPRNEWTLEPLRFDEMRRGAWDPKERVRDMDVSGVIMSLCFPTALIGFGGQRFFRMKDRELGLACMRAYNDWMIDEWCAADRRRFIPQQLMWYPDPEIAAAEVRRNAERGFKAVCFSENPEALGFPSIYTDFWDPFFRACEETSTVINLHIGSSSRMPQGQTGSGTDVRLALFPMNAMVASVDWLFARIPLRYPNLKIVLSESGISWIPMILERLRRIMRMAETDRSTWQGMQERPDEVYKRAFWFCSIEDPSGIAQRELIGVDRIMIETDYPHNDTSWPDTQAIVAEELGHLPEDDLRAIAYKNAAHVYDLDVALIESIADELSVAASGAAAS